MNIFENENIVGVDIPDGGTYNIPPNMSNNLFVASGFKGLTKCILPMASVLNPVGQGTQGEFIYVSNMGSDFEKPVLEVIQSRNKRSFVELGSDREVNLVAIPWGATVLFFAPTGGSKYIYYIRFNDPNSIVLPQNPTFNTVTASNDIYTPQLEVQKFLLMYSKMAKFNPKIRLAQNFLSSVGANATLSLDRTSCYLEVGGAEYGAGSYRLIGMGYQKAANDVQPLMFGFQETDSSGNTVGDFVVFLRDTTANGAPKEVFRIKHDGTITGNFPSSKNNVVILNDEAAASSQNPNHPSYFMSAGDVIFLDSSKPWTITCIDTKSKFKDGDKVEINIHKGAAMGQFGELATIQSQDAILFLINGQNYAGLHPMKPCCFVLTYIDGSFVTSYRLSDNAILNSTLDTPIN